MDAGAFRMTGFLKSLEETITNPPNSPMKKRNQLIFFSVEIKQVCEVLINQAKDHFQLTAYIFCASVYHICTRGRATTVQCERKHFYVFITLINGVYVFRRTSIFYSLLTYRNHDKLEWYILNLCRSTQMVIWICRFESIRLLKWKKEQLSHISFWFIYKKNLKYYK